MFNRIKSIKLNLQVPLTGPYTRCLRRPAPEVEALGQGETIALLRAGRILAPVPLYPGDVACFYRRGARLSPKDFSQPEWAERILDQRQQATKLAIQYLAVPAGYVRLPQSPLSSQLAAEFTPWLSAPIEAWRTQLKNPLWLNVLRIYRFDPLMVSAQMPWPLDLAPFRAEGLEAVLPRASFKARLDDLQQRLERGQTPPSPQSPQGKSAPYTLADFSEETGCDEAVLNEWEQRLQRKRQIILYGPPGTGKTFVAERLAKRLAASAGLVQLVQFHPAYAYEDFVQGLRPQADGGEVRYQLVEGRFVQFCRRAAELAPAACVLVIDEINRAHLAQVLGELMYLLEYRGRTVVLAGGGSPFSVPDNVYLIGTMNTADRSIALVDQALRRRFAFVRLGPDLAILRRFLKRHNLPLAGLVELVEAINRQIDDPDLALGFSFFMQDGAGLRQALPLIWRGEIEPYLEEIFFNRAEVMAAYRWEKVAVSHLKEWV